MVKALFIAVTWEVVGSTLALGVSGRRSIVVAISSIAALTKPNRQQEHYNNLNKQ